MQEPSSAISAAETAAGTASTASTQEQEDELLRVEALLAVRAREASTLQTELTRQRTLLREALERVSVTTSAELAALRRARDGAVQRAIEAELGRAALAFELDETRACLQSGPEAGAVSDVRSLYARVAQFEETEEAQRARLVLADHDLSAARTRIQQLERKLVEEGEAFELSLMRERAAAEQVAKSARAATAQHELSGLAGEVNGMRARLAEAESAFAKARQRRDATERALAESAQKLAEIRAKSAELAVLAQSRAGQISELGHELGRHQQETRGLQGQLNAALLAQQTERQARDVDAQTWMQRLAAFESERASFNASDAGRRLAAWTHELRVLLVSLRTPLTDLEVALADPAQSSDSPVLAHAPDGPDATQPGTLFDAATVAELEDKLRAAESRLAELDAALAARQVQARDAGLTTLKGELIDTRADAARLSDDLTKERVRRRKLIFTVRALQAASESGEAPGPWIEELITLLNEGASIPPYGSQPPP